MELVIHRDKLESSTERERESKRERKERNIWERETETNRKGGERKCSVGVLKKQNKYLINQKNGRRRGKHRKQK